MFHPIRFYRYWFNYNIEKINNDAEITFIFFLFGLLPFLIYLGLYFWLEPFFYSSIKESYNFRKKRFKKFMESYKSKYDK